MSKKMWNKIFKSKTNKNSKTLQAANKINKRSSIYEEYQQLNAALDIVPINEKLKDNTKATTTFAATANDPDKKTQTTTKIPHSATTTFSKVVNTLTLKRSQSSNSSKDLKHAAGNGNEGKTKNSKKNNGNNITTPTEVPESNASVQLAPCPICARTFNPVTLRKHVGICEKMAMKKRNKFDSSRQRREGTDLATYPLPKNFGLPEKALSSTSITQARSDRGQSPKPVVQQVCSPILARKKVTEDLIRTTARASMRKAVANNNTSTVTAPAATSTPLSNFNRDRMRSSERSLTRRGTQPPPAEQCPHCERCFGIKAYDRHVEWCKEKALLASIKQGSSKNEGNVAKARLEARTKYRAPCLKTKRSINREKYSGLAGEEPETEDNSKCSKTSLNKPQDDSLMTMSMTSSMCSERKITNSTTGNINEPLTIKRQHNKNSRDKNQNQQPPTKTEIAGGAAAAPEQTQNEKSIINLEFEMPEYHLMGEQQMAATAINKKRQAKRITKTEEVTVTAKIKPLKQKQRQQRQQQEPVEAERDLKMNSSKSYKNSKPAVADIHLNLPSMAKILKQNKSGSDLSFKTMLCNNEGLQQLNDAFQDDNDYSEDRKHDYEDVEVECEATEAPVENVDFSKSLTFYGSSIKSEENEKILFKLPTENVEKSMVMKEYFEKSEQLNFYSNCTTFSDNESENDTFEIFSDPREIVIEKANNNLTQDPCHARAEEYEEFVIKQYPDDIATNYDSQDIRDPEITDTTKSLFKAINQKNFEKDLRPQSGKTKIVNSNPKEMETNTRRNFSATENEETCSSFKDFSTQQQIYENCLIDSNELRLQQITNKEKLNSQRRKETTTTAEELSNDQWESNFEAIKSGSKSETFIRAASGKASSRLELHDTSSYENVPSLEVAKSFENLASNFSPIKPTPTSSRLSTAPAQLNTANTASLPTKTPRIMSLNVCQPKRKKVLRQTASCTNALPMKAVMWPLSMQQLEICGTSSAPFEQKNASESVKGRIEIDKEEKQASDIEVDDVDEARNMGVWDKPIKVIKKPPQLKRNRSFTVFGLPDNYDPFLSAKRQLEELCSPTAESNDMPTTPLTPKLPSMPATPPNNNNKMSTSLILSPSTPNTTPPSLMTASQIPQQTQKTPILARSSSFRRTSSLRGPRRSPMLSTRPPLFAQKHRPTIQRGLSDEGPISTNFLKPEEYDEMPVRSVCVNDFAVNKSPRVVRRDTSASNRKQPLKLNINAANGNNSSTNMTSPNVAESEVVANNSASKYVSKTDSLAVFLKFEHELEKLNTSATDSEHKMENLMEAPTTASAMATALGKLDGLLTAKELKDKSNNLSKQNSAKNIKADLLDAIESSTNLNTTVTLATNDTEAPKYRQVRLAPLDTKPNTPLTKPTTPQLAQPQAPAAAQLTPCSAKNSNTQSLEQNAHKSAKPVALSSLFASSNKNTKQTSLLYSERNNPAGSDYIDPKLINKWDNLPINMHLKHTDSDTSEPRQEHFSSSSSESSAPAKKASSQSQQAKFLPTVKQQQSPAPPQQQQQQQLQQQQQNNFIQNQLPLPATNSQRNSAEGRNLLKRRMRLGRNQFLYDASPEGDSCSADDEGANRSSMEGDTSQQHYNLLREPEKAFERLGSVQVNPIDASSFMPPLPAFDDFDFEEFLSSFENDEEQFPLFKDCREFLMNRTSKKQRSMLMSNSTTQNTNTTNNTAHNNNSTNLKKSPSPQTFPPLTPQTLSNAGQHFQFPSLSQHPKNLFNSFSHNTRARNKYDQLTAANKSSDTFCMNSQTEEYKDLDSQSINQKREIFISIETEQNDSDKSPISPNSIRNMVGNPQTVVEVEVDAAHDNKFSKISDDDDADVSQNSSRSKNFTAHLLVEHLPNVQLNNAKNLMQKIQEDFRQIGEEINDNQRLANEQRTAPLDVNMNTNSSITGNVRNMATLNRSAGPPSVDAYGDSDELSSLDGYPLSSPNSRLGVSSKTSADSAYGSLSRQRSSELTAQRSSSSRNRSMMSSSNANTVLNRPLTEETSLARSRQLSASSSSSSEHALPSITSTSSSYHKQQQQHLYNNNNMASDLDDVMRYELNNNSSVSSNNNNNSSNYDGQTTHTNLTGATNSHSNLESLQHFTSNSTMSTSMKMSKFCHECGSKFLLEQAKFCMDCGVKRIVL